jgi:V8-like Glu-specific endopeptidase
MGTDMAATSAELARPARPARPRDHRARSEGPGRWRRGGRRVGQSLRQAGQKAGVLVVVVAISLGAGGFRATPLSQSQDTLTAGAQSMSPMAGLAPMADAEAVPFSGTPAIGALFTTNGEGLGSHFCSASVVNSPEQDLLITAAHCVSDTTSGSIAFVPGFYDGKMPYGIWRITRIIMGQTWVSAADPAADVAFLVVSGRGKAKIQQLTGGERLGLGGPAGQLVSVVGYPETTNIPVRCGNLAREFSPTQLVFDCGGYTNGTSGGPLLEDISPSTGLGTVIGVIGGYELGGDTASVSYAARFGSMVANLYQAAIVQP